MKRNLAPTVCAVLSLLFLTYIEGSTACIDNYSKFYFETNLSHNPEPNASNSFNSVLTIEQLKPFTDIRLDSVIYGEKKTIEGFLFVTDAYVISNSYDPNTFDIRNGKPPEPYHVINTRRGDNTKSDSYVTEIPTSGSDGATKADLIASYGNRNLNSIKYNRERGAGELAILFFYLGARHGFRYPFRVSGR